MTTQNEPRYTTNAEYEIIGETWFNTMLSACTIGVVVIADEFDICKAYIGPGVGISIEYDRYLIAAYGAPFPIEAATAIGIVPQEYGIRWIKKQFEKAKAEAKSHEEEKPSPEISSLYQATHADPSFIIPVVPAGTPQDPVIGHGGEFGGAGASTSFDTSSDSGVGGGDGGSSGGGGGGD